METAPSIIPATFLLDVCDVKPGKDLGDSVWQESLGYSGPPWLTLYDFSDLIFRQFAGHSWYMFINTSILVYTNILIYTSVPIYTDIHPNVQ